MTYKKVSRQQINEVVALIKEVEKLSGKKIMFKEDVNLRNMFGQILLATRNMKHFLDILHINPELKYGRIIYRNLYDIEKTAKNAIHYQKKLGEAVGEVKGNNIVSQLQEFTKSFTVLTKQLELLEKKIPKYSKRIVQCTKIVSDLQEKIGRLIQEETQHDDTSLEEDVDMDIDQIMQEPETVQKLNTKKININLVDKNSNRNTTSTTSSTGTTSY